MPITKVANSHANVKQFTDSDVVPNFSLLNRLTGMYDAVVGTPVQVANGAATHTSLQAAINSLPNGGAIYFLTSTITENITLTGSNIRVIGKGRTSLLSGNVTVVGNYNDLDSFKISGNVILNGNNNFLKNWIASTSTFTNTGVANDYRLSQE